jgi:protein SCO1
MTRLDYLGCFEAPAITRRARRIISVISVTSALLAAAAIPLCAAPQSGNSEAQVVVSHGQAFPAITLTDQNGAPVSLAKLRGKPVLLGFVHTSCKGPCELMTAKMKQVDAKLGAHLDTRITLVTVTTDPDHDGPAQMLAYAKAQDADQPGWFFLSGKPANVRRVLASYNIHSESEEDEMTHVLDLFLIAPDGTRIRQYQGLNTSPDEIASDIRKTLARR